MFKCYALIKVGLCHSKQTEGAAWRWSGQSARSRSIKDLEARVGDSVSIAFQSCRSCYNLLMRGWMDGLMDNAKESTLPLRLRFIDPKSINLGLTVNPKLNPNHTGIVLMDSVNVLHSGRKLRPTVPYRGADCVEYSRAGITIKFAHDNKS